MDFKQWLSRQCERKDAIGKLAQDLLDDPISPLWSNRLSTYAGFLIFRNGGKRERETLEDAFAEWHCAQRQTARDDAANSIGNHALSRTETSTEDGAENSTPWPK